MKLPDGTVYCDNCKRILRDKETHSGYTDVGYEQLCGVCDSGVNQEHLERLSKLRYPCCKYWSKQ